MCVPLAPLKPDFRPTAATLVFTYGAPRPYTDRSLPFFFPPVGQKISFHLSAINTSEYPEHVAGVWAGMFCFTSNRYLRVPDLNIFTEEATERACIPCECGPLSYVRVCVPGTPVILTGTAVVELSCRRLGIVISHT